jgi:hypothetical protein
VRPVSGTLDVSALTLPLDLPRAPWTLERGDVRRTRRLALPPGLYRLEVDARAGPAPTTVHLSRFEAATDDLSLDWAYLRVDRPLAPFRLPLPLGAPRFCLVVTGVADRTLVTGARLVPLSVVPRRLRPSFPWMAVPAWDRYRVGDDALRITVVDRSEPEDGGFRLAGEWGAFVLETLPGAPIVVRVVRPSPRPDDALYWNERRVALPRERDTTLTLRSDAGAGLGAARALPVWLRAERGWVAFTTAVTTIE